MIRRPDYLYNLLPAIYRQKDLERGSPLRAVFAALQDQHDLLETDIQALYADWFVETCEPWVLPYIGELVAAGRLARRIHPAIDTRSLVANTLAYRRRKGTPTTLRQAIEQATGWPSRIAEPRQLVAMTPSAARPGENAGRTVDFRKLDALAQLQGPFDALPRTATIDPEGPYNGDRLSIWLWRLQSYPLGQVEAAVVKTHPGCRSFHPLGLDTPLFNRRRNAGSDALQPDQRTLPIPLTRAALALDLAAIRAGKPSPASFFSGPPALSVSLRGSSGPVAIEPSAVVVADLSQWERPSDAPTARVAIDPERGRLMLLQAEDRDAPVVTDHCYGFADDLGGGCYVRPAAPSPEDRLHRRAWLDTIWSGSADRSGRFDLQAQILAWLQQADDGIIEIPDSGTYVGTGGKARKAAGWRLDLSDRACKNLVIRAAAGRRPCLVGDLYVISGKGSGTLILDGLLIGGTLRIEGDMTVIVRHCTIVAPPDVPSIVAMADADAPAMIRLFVQSSIIGAVRLPSEGARLDLRNAIVDGGHGVAISGGKGFGPQTAAVATTISGSTRVRQMEASNAIFLGPLDVAETQRGFVRHCFVASGSRTPERFRCELPRPAFVSTRRGQPGYFYFSPGNPREVLTGASDGLAIGAYHDLGDALRGDNYADALTEYLPYRLQVLTHYAS